jgi:molybdopterin converting factor small subunit
MAVVHFPDQLREYTGGLEAVVIPASRVHDLVDAVVSRFPGLATAVDEMAIAVDGEIYPASTYATLGPDSDVCFVPRIAGG